MTMLRYRQMSVILATLVLLAASAAAQPPEQRPPGERPWPPGSTLQAPRESRRAATQP